MHWAHIFSPMFTCFRTYVIHVLQKERHWESSTSPISKSMEEMNTEDDSNKAEKKTSTITLKSNEEFSRFLQFLRVRFHVARPLMFCRRIHAKSLALFDHLPERVDVRRLLGHLQLVFALELTNVLSVSNITHCYRNRIYHDFTSLFCFQFVDSVDDMSMTN